MQVKTIAVIVIAAIPFFLLMWSPWITYDYAIEKVVEHLGGNDTVFNYLGEPMSVGDVPKSVVWYPFVKAVYFPSEAIWFVGFHGGVL